MRCSPAGWNMTGTFVPIGGASGFVRWRNCRRPGGRTRLDTARRGLGEYEFSRLRPLATMLFPARCAAGIGGCELWSESRGIRRVTKKKPRFRGAFFTIGGTWRHWNFQGVSNGCYENSNHAAYSFISHFICLQKITSRFSNFGNVRVSTMGEMSNQERESDSPECDPPCYCRFFWSSFVLLGQVFPAGNSLCKVNSVYPIITNTFLLRNNCFRVNIFT